MEFGEFLFWVVLVGYLLWANLSSKRESANCKRFFRQVLKEELEKIPLPVRRQMVIDCGGEREFERRLERILISAKTSTLVPKDNFNVSPQRDPSVREVIAMELRNEFMRSE